MDKYIDIIYKHKRGKLVFFDPLTYIGLVLNDKETITLSSKHMDDVLVCANGKKVTLEKFFKSESTDPRWYDESRKKTVLHIFPILCYKKE